MKHEGYNRYRDVSTGLMGIYSTEKQAENARRFYSIPSDPRTWTVVKGEHWWELHASRPDLGIPAMDDPLEAA